MPVREGAVVAAPRLGVALRAARVNLPISADVTTPTFSDHPARASALYVVVFTKSCARKLTIANEMTNETRAGDVGVNSAKGHAFAAAHATTAANANAATRRPPGRLDTNDSRVLALNTVIASVRMSFKNAHVCASP